MNLSVGLLFLVLFVTASSSSVPAKKGCNFKLDTSVPGKISGKYKGKDFFITFRASLDGDLISSSTEFHNSAGSFKVLLFFPDTKGPEVPGIVGRVIRAASKVAMETKCSIPPHLSSNYEEFANALFHCTSSMGSSQLRFSVMYHVSVVGTAGRICQEKVPLCTPSPSYEFGEELFLCNEDIVEMFPKKIKEIQRENPASKNRNKRACFFPNGWGLMGSDTCCCGNYPGCCVYANVGCCLHDNICWCCGMWYCGWQCRPGRGC